MIMDFLIIALINAVGIGICYFLVFLAGKFTKIKAKILVTFLLFGLLVGGWSFWMGNTDAVAGINLPGYYFSDRLYNKYLLPYWQRTLEPVGYQEIPVVRLEPTTPPEPAGGEVVGTEMVPIYDFPIKKVDYLFLPITLLLWGFIGLIAQLIYNASKRPKSLPA